MIEVELFDGTILEFPEGTSQAVIDRVAKSETMARRPKQAEALPAGPLTQSVPPMPMPASPELQTMGPGPTGRIDPALYDQGILPRRFAEQTAPQTDALSGDYSRAIMGGLMQGVTNLADTPGAIVSGVGGLGADAMGLLGLPPEVVAEAKRTLQFTPLGSGNTMREGVSMATGGASEYEGQSRGARIVGNVAEYMPAAAVSPGNMALNLLNFGVVPGVASELAGQATEGVKIPESIPLVGGRDAEPLARATASIFSPLAAAGLENAALRTITPNPADPRFVEASRKMAKEGVDLTAGQRVNSQNLRYIEDTRPRTQDIVQNQLDQFTQAALSRIGVKADGATPRVMLEAGRKIGGEFEVLARRNSIKPDATMGADVQRAVADYADNSTTGIIAGIQKTANTIDAYVKSGKSISGDQYQQWRSTLSRLSVSGENVQAKTAARDILGALDRAMERTLTAAKRPEEIAAYREARSKWRDYLAITDAVDGAGQNAALGVITPQNLGGAIRAQDEKSYVTGQRDIGELARAGTITMPTLPNSGTQPRMAAQAIQVLAGGGGGTAAGGLAYAMTRDPAIAAMVAGVGGMLPIARNALAATAPMQAYLANQIAPGRVPYNAPGLLGPTITTTNQR